ncbi:MAG: OmpA family protein, partial [Spirochaetales bacterium]|nr:OmpA family protein [Spirochaetales bacterium]
ILGRYSSYRIMIEGHANRLIYSSRAAAEREEQEELKPLSKARAQTVREALAERGIQPDRMSTKGLGGTQPVVPYDAENPENWRSNSWKNRRVEFILLKDKP